MRDSESAELIYELQTGGHKLTKLRQSLIDIFSSRQEPLLLEELGKLLHDRFIKVHRASLYRELAFLQNKQIIVPVTLEDGKLRYEFADRSHHHHAVCVKCKKIEDVEVAEEKLRLEDLVITNNNFQITRHTLEFFGVCGECK